MGSVRRRLERIEERRAAKLRPRRRSEAERYKDWQARASIRRNQETPRSAKVARSRIAWLRRVGKLGEFASAEHLIDDIMAGPDGSGGLQPPEERSRTLVEHEVYSSVKRRDSGLEHLQVPPQWAEALEASEKLREGFLSMLPEHFAQYFVQRCAMQERGEPEAALEDHARRYEEPYGITRELLTTALGPDAGLLTDEERSWIITAPLDDVMTGERGWRIAEAIRRAVDETER